MSTMHYFSDKFSKIAKRWGFPPPFPQRRLTSVLLTWNYVIWPSSAFGSWLWRNWTSKI